MIGDNHKSVSEFAPAKAVLLI